QSQRSRIARRSSRGLDRRRQDRARAPRPSGLDLAQSFALSYAHCDDDPAAAPGLSHRRAPRHRRRSAAQPRQKRDGRIMALVARGSIHLSHTLHSLRHRNFRLLFFGTSLSQIGDFAQALPRLLLGAVGGAIVDRIPRRRLLLSTQVLAMAQAFSFWALVYFDLIR